MWFRDEARPTPYRGQVFRSATEAKVAEQLDVLGADWHYEVKPQRALSWFTPSYAPDPPDFTGYLPDFTIVDAPQELDLPFWVEVKPAELLYAVRDHLGCPERFTTDFHSPTTAAQLQAAQLTEIWKPKRLAEFYQRPVLVVHQINRNRTLSVWMDPDGITLSRRHPAVNFRQVTADAKRAEEDAARQARWAAEAVEHQRRQAERAAEFVGYFRTHGRPAQFAGRCLVCGAYRPADELRIARGRDGWRSLCVAHLSEPEA